MILCLIVLGILVIRLGLVGAEGLKITKLFKIVAIAMKSILCDWPVRMVTQNKIIWLILQSYISSLLSDICTYFGKLHLTT